MPTAEMPPVLLHPYPVLGFDLQVTEASPSVAPKERYFASAAAPSLTCVVAADDAAHDDLAGGAATPGAEKHVTRQA